MKLYLSSIGIPDSKAYLSLFTPGKTHSIALIPTAWTADPPEKGAPYIAATHKQLAGLGFAVEIIDLADYNNAPDKLYRKLRPFSGLWVMGGNTFWLNHWVRRSGLHTIIRKLLTDGCVYGGESAGAVIAGPTLRGVELLDDYTQLHISPIPWKGLGLVDHGIMPHYGEAPAIDKALRQMEIHYPVRPLRDDEFIILDS